MSERYYNTFNKAKNYKALRFLAGDGLQSRELNEMQDAARTHIEDIANAIFREGDRISDADIAINSKTGEVTVEAGRVFLRGAVREVAESSFTIPTTERVGVGLRFHSSVVTYLDDPTLRDPSTDTRNAGEPGAQRLHEYVTWGWDGEYSSDGLSSPFHAVYSVVNGILENKTQPPALDAVVQTIARYDREANGSYIATGLRLRFLEYDNSDNKYVFSLSEGTGNVNGFKVEKPQATRLRWDADPDLRFVNAEPQAFNDRGTGTAVLALNRAPVASISEITVTKEITEAVTHGAFTGASDNLQNTQVLSIESVTQGDTTYEEGTDFVRSGDEVDWSPNSDEPAPGSTYNVTYRYIETITPDAFDSESVTVSGAVTGTTVFIDYEWKLPRIDTLAMASDGQLFRIKGVSQTTNPQSPEVAANLLLLADVYYEWYSGVDPTVIETGVRAVPISELEEMQTSIAELFDLVSIERLRNDTAITDPTTKYGVFVDPFTDDDLRDQGLSQTAAIIEGALTLPIVAAVLEPSKGANAAHTLDYTLTPVLEQLQSTTDMKINPYMNFAPVPAEVELVPSSDSWTVVQTNWASSITRSFTTGWGNRSWTTTTTRTQQVGSTTEAILTARQRDVDWSLTNFGPNERLVELLFDGIDITPTPEVKADAQGELSGTFTIPAGVPTGTKQVSFRGHGGSYGETSFVSNGWLVTRTMRRVIERTTRRWWAWPGPDPLAQTFTLDADAVIGAVDIWFDKIGDRSKQVRVQIRETLVGQPTQVILSETIVNMNTATNTDVTVCEFDPTFLRGGTEYAIVILTDDANHSVRVAELGKFDPDTGWITSQPYTIGVLLSSSNARTWTPHQERDLKFRLKACKFTQTEKTVNLGSIVVSGATDFIVLAGVERISSDTDVVFVLRDSSNQEFVMSEGQAFNLTQRVSDTLTVEARMRGSFTATPILFPGVQVIAGSLAGTGKYVSRALTADATFDGVVRMDVLDPGISNVSVFMQVKGDEQWAELTLQSGTPVSFGFEERVYAADKLAGVGDGKTTRIMIVLNGTPANRPFVRNLRGFAK